MAPSPTGLAIDSNHSAYASSVQSLQTVRLNFSQSLGLFSSTGPTSSATSFRSLTTLFNLIESIFTLSETRRRHLVPLSVISNSLKSSHGVTFDNTDGSVRDRFLAVAGDLYKVEEKGMERTNMKGRGKRWRSREGVEVGREEEEKIRLLITSFKNKPKPKPNPIQSSLETRTNPSTSSPPPSPPLPPLSSNTTTSSRVLASYNLEQRKRARFDSYIQSHGIDGVSLTSLVNLADALKSLMKREGRSRAPIEYLSEKLRGAVTSNAQASKKDTRKKLQTLIKAAEGWIISEDNVVKVVGDYASVRARLTGKKGKSSANKSAVLPQRHSSMAAKQASQSSKATHTTTTTTSTTSSTTSTTSTITNAQQQFLPPMPSFDSAPPPKPSSSSSSSSCLKPLSRSNSITPSSSKKRPHSPTTSTLENLPNKKPLRINLDHNQDEEEGVKLHVKDIGDKGERGLKRLFEEMNNGRRI
ncbi:hypothetical protein TL16_g11978 [Triparma laevis f. inornata]|uniref:Uncharacterized protein n=1 Tax=Triparma laevis f. inornata TaxID=1714386 RepID=A0A9W7EV26_9STRA|nr:hypothetical protein TL16_g11978 [Triparma laevis f. inornata]